MSSLHRITALFATVARMMGRSMGPLLSTMQIITGGSLTDCKCEDDFGYTDSTMWRRQMSLRDYPDLKEELICFRCGARWFI